MNSRSLPHAQTLSDFAHANSPDFKPDGKWDGKTRRIGINARLFKDFDAAEAPVTVIDGKNLW